MPQRLLLASLALGAVALFLWFLSGHDSRLPLEPPEPPEPPEAASAAGTGASTRAPARGDLEAPHEPAGSAPAILALESPATSPDSSRSAAVTRREEELATALWLEGRVVIPAGTPSDEEIFVAGRRRSFEHGGDHRARVAPDGRFRVALAPKSRRAHLWIEARYLYLEKRLRVDLSGLEHEVRLEPRLGGRIRCQLVPPPGTRARPEEQPAVRALGESNHGSGGAPVQPDWIAELDGLPAAEAYRLSFDSPEFADVRQEGLAVRAGETLDVVLPLRTGHRIRGRVEDEEGLPLGGVEVDAVGAQRSTESEPDGTFRLAGLPSGEIYLSVLQRGYRPWTGSVVFEGMEPTEIRDERITLLRGNTVAGTVRWADGQPAAGAKLSADAPGSFRHPLMRDHGDLVWTADDSGAFEIRGLGDWPLRLDASCQRVEQVEVTSSITGRTRTKKKRTTVRGHALDIPPGTLDVEIVLGGVFELAGVVRGPDGSPPDRFTVRVTRVAAGEREDARTERFESGDGSFRVGDLSPGTWEFSARAIGYPNSVGVRRTLPGSGELLELTLERFATVAGHVRESSGRPIAGAELTSMVWSGNTASGSGSTSSAQDGGYLLEDLPPHARIWLTAKAPGYAEADVELELEGGEARTGFDFELATGASLSGVVLRLDEAPDAGRVIWARSTTDRGRRSTTSDDGGRFRFESVSPGRVTVWADSTDRDLATLLGEDFDGSARSIVERRAALELDPGEARHVVLRYGPVDVISVSGHIRANGEPCVGMNLTLQGKGDTRPRVGSSEVGEDGLYRASVAGPGEYAFHLWDPATGAFFARSVTIPAARSATVNLDFDVGAIRGRVLGPGGAPLAGIAVRAETMDPEGSGTSYGRAEDTTDSQGRYQLAKVQAGTYRVVASASGDRDRPPGPSEWSDALVDDVHVTANSQVTGVDLRLAPGGSVQGILRTATGTTVGRAPLFAYDASGTRLGVEASSSKVDRFRIDGLPVGRVTLLCQHERWVGFTDVEVRAGESTSVELTLRAAGSLRVTLRAPDGTSAMGLLEVDDPFTGAHFTPERWWWIGPLAEGEHTLRATLDGAQHVRTVQVVAGQETSIEIAFD